MKSGEQAVRDLKIELADLTGKIDRLLVFVKEDHPAEEKLLLEQLKSMEDYKLCLIERLNKTGGLD